MTCNSTHQKLFTTNQIVFSVASISPYQALTESRALKHEIEGLTGGPHLHVLNKVSELEKLPIQQLKNLQAQLKNDLDRLEKVSIFDWIPLSTQDQALESTCSRSSLAQWLINKVFDSGANGPWFNSWYSPKCVSVRYYCI